MLPHIITVEHGKSRTIKSVRDGEDMNLLCEMIDNSKDSIVTIGGVKACDEVD